MRRRIRRIWNHRASIVMFCIMVSVYFSVFACFFLLMGINNWPLRHASRTLGTTLLTWFVMTFVMQRVYGRFDVGKRKNKPIISSMLLSTLITDMVTYLQLQIMNVNENNHSTLSLFGPDLLWLMLCIVLQFVMIVIFTHIGNTTYFKLHPPKNCLVVYGDEEDAHSTAQKFDRYRLQWRITESIPFSDPELVEKIRKNDVVVLDKVSGEMQRTLLIHCYNLQKDVICRSQVDDIMLSNAAQLIVVDRAFLSIEHRKMTLTQRIVKRCTDIGVSGTVLLLLSPLLGLIALLIHMEDGGKVLFRQQRMTVNGRIFTILKFRTMTEKASGNQHQTSAGIHDDRITRIGQVLRRFRLDELPQLWNIFCGDMTLVGPRPEMMDNIIKYKKELPEFVYREKMKAGLTGFAQIEGKYNTTAEDKLMLDLMYIENFSLWLDFKLLFRTLLVFFRSDSTEGFTNGTDKTGNLS